MIQQIPVQEDNIIAFRLSGKLSHSDYQAFLNQSQAEALHSDLIVVGTHGHRGIARLLGSTASAVSHNARCDVLTVRIDATD